MDGEAGPRQGNVHRSLDRRFVPPLIGAGILYLLLMTGMVAFGSNWRFFQVAYALWYSVFALCLYLSFKARLFGRMERISTWKVCAAIFLIALSLHVVFLARGPALSQDILRLEDRGRRILDGQFPYRDFQPNKPPLYIWMVGLISLPFGPHEIVFRVVFSLMDAAIPLVLYLIGADIDKERGSGGAWFDRKSGFGFRTGALVYALCPIPILEVGLAGHFDPSVVLLTLLAFWALYKGRLWTAGILLGAGLSLKVYPLFLMPIFFLAVQRWIDRARFTLAFLIVPVVSALPVLYIYPRGILGYFEYQTVGWYSGVGLMSILDYISRYLGLPASLGFITMTGLLLFGGAFIYWRGTHPEFHRRVLDFVFAIAAFFALYLVHFTFVILLAYTRDVSGWFLGTAIMVISLAEFAAFVMIYIRNDPGRFRSRRPILSTIFTDRIPIERIPLLSSAVILLLLLVSAQFHPWYMLWIIPFLSWTPNYWSMSILVLFGMYHSHVYYPVDIGSF